MKILVWGKYRRYGNLKLEGESQTLHLEAFSHSYPGGRNVWGSHCAWKWTKEDVGIPTFSNICEQVNQHNIQIYGNDLYFRFFLI